MSEKEFASKFDVSCSMKEILQYKTQLLDSDVADKEIINELFEMILHENKPFLDRAKFMTILVNYICTTGNSVSFIMNLFQELLRKDGCMEEAIEYATKAAYKQAHIAREIKMRNAILEKKRLQRETLREEEKLKKLENSIDMSKTCVSFDTARFLIRNGFTYEEIESKFNPRIVSQEDIDPILWQYRINCVEEKELVSIADIVGYDYAWLGGENDLLKSFPIFFDSNKYDGYHQRSLSMLDFTTKDALEKLTPSFSEEPIKLANTLDGRYTINSNGMHRYTVLRSLYCMEMINAKGDKEQENIIYEKYKVPALVSKIDSVKTYANYILTTLKIVKYVSNEMDSNFRKTGRAKIELFNHEVVFLTNEELLQYIKHIMIKNEPNVQYLIENANENLLHFLSFVVSEIIEKNNFASEKQL